MVFSCEKGSLPFCCGFYEAGAFREGEKKSVYCDHWDDTPEGLVRKILDSSEGRPVIFNFVKAAIYDDEEDPIGFEEKYDCHDLREYVRKFKGVIDLGRHINPGTNNKIHSLVIKDY